MKTKPPAICATVALLSTFVNVSSAAWLKKKYLNYGLQHFTNFFIQKDTYLTSCSFCVSIGFIFSKALKPWLITRRKAAGISYCRNFLTGNNPFATLKTMYVYYTKDLKLMNNIEQKLLNETNTRHLLFKCTHKHVFHTERVKMCKWSGITCINSCNNKINT